MRKRVKGKLYFLARDAKTRMRNYNREKSIFEQIPYAKAKIRLWALAPSLEILLQLRVVLGM